MQRLLLLVILLTACSTAQIAPQVDAIYPQVDALYIDLHKNPELAFQEKRTAAELAGRVRALGYEVTTGIGGTGLVAIMKNGAGPAVMLRTELDALPVQEKTGLPYASTVTARNAAGEDVPVMHACGHDIHMASWFGTATLMARNKDKWHGTLMLIAQPAEEIGKGAVAMLQDGLFTRFPKPDYALALHDSSNLPAGVIGYGSGFIFAASDSVDITMIGYGGHGAAPHRAVDPIVMASRLVLALQTIVSRENNPLDPAVITVGAIHGGTQGNIIPEQVKLQLTVRSFAPEVRKKLLQAIEREARGVAIAANAPREPQVKITPGTAAVYNDPALTTRMAVTLKAVLGPEKVVETPALMVSEDFSQYGSAGVRAVLLHLGAVEPAKFTAAGQTGAALPSLHSPLWAPDKQPTLKTAIAAETAILLDLFNARPSTGSAPVPK